MLSGRLPDPVNIDASNFGESVVDRINGVSIQKLEDVSRAIAKGDSKYIVINLWNQLVPIILPRNDSKVAHPNILKRYGVFPEKWLDHNEIFFKGVSVK